MCVVVCVRVCVYALLGASFLLFWCPFQHRLVVCFLLVFNYDCLLVLLYFARASSVCVCVCTCACRSHLSILARPNHCTWEAYFRFILEFGECAVVHVYLRIPDPHSFLFGLAEASERERDVWVCRVPRYAAFQLCFPCPPHFQCSSSFDGAY